METRGPELSKAVSIGRFSIRVLEISGACSHLFNNPFLRKELTVRISITRGATIVSLFAALLAAPTALPGTAFAEEIGHVDTAFKLLGRNHQVTVEAFDDPKVKGVTCFISMARKGGLTGTLGIAEETSDASIACRQVGPIAFAEAIEGDDEGEEVFKKRQSIFFKRLNVVRFLDVRRNTLVYLAYSDKLIDGSPQNSVSAVAMMPWGDQAPAKVLTK